MKKITAYKCEYCGKIDESKVKIASHIITCKKNPNFKPCKKCDHCHMYFGGDYGFRCSAKNNEGISNPDRDLKCKKFILLKPKKNNLINMEFEMIQKIKKDIGI